LRFSARKVLLTVGDLLIIAGALVVPLALRADFGLSRFSFWHHAPWLRLFSARWLAIGLALDIYHLARAVGSGSTLSSPALSTYWSASLPPSGPVVGQQRCACLRQRSPA
jgi:hypothetical protein